MDEARRRLLTLFGSTSAAALAGCLSGDDSGSDPATPTPTTHHDEDGPGGNGGGSIGDWTDPASVPMSDSSGDIPLLSDPVARLASEGQDTPTEDFGSSVAVSPEASTAIIGARRHGGLNGAGAAYVFEATGDGWSQRATLTPTDASENEGFGRSVALSADATTAVIGANSGYFPGGESDSTGRAYVFEQSDGAWSQQATLTSDIADESDFGLSVALSADGSTTIVTAPNDADGFEPGRAYVFGESGNGWDRRAKFTSTDADTREVFGVSVGLSGDGSTAIIGAYVDPGQEGIGPGLAYEFTNSEGGWSQQATLPRYKYGRSGEHPIAVSDDTSTVIMGARSEAYVFEKFDAEWTTEARLVPEYEIRRDRLGASIAVSDDGSTAVIGAPATGPPSDQSGSAYVFEQSGTGWSNRAKLAVEDGGEADRFGYSVAVSEGGSTALIGAIGDEDQNGFRAGSAYVFSIPE